MFVFKDRLAKFLHFPLLFKSDLAPKNDVVLRLSIFFFLFGCFCFVVVVCYCVSMSICLLVRMT